MGTGIDEAQPAEMAPFAMISGGGRFADHARKALSNSGIDAVSGWNIVDAVSGVSVPRGAVWIVSVTAMDANDAERWCAACAITARGIDKRMILVITRAQIDLAGAYLLGSGAQLLCEPDTGDFNAALRLAFSGHGRPSESTHPWQ